MQLGLHWESCGHRKETVSGVLKHLLWEYLLAPDFQNDGVRDKQKLGLAREEARVFVAGRLFLSEQLSVSSQRCTVNLHS